MDYEWRVQIFAPTHWRPLQGLGVKICENKNRALKEEDSTKNNNNNKKGGGGLGLGRC